MATLLLGFHVCPNNVGQARGCLMQHEADLRFQELILVPIVLFVPTMILLLQKQIQHKHRHVSHYQ